MKLGPNLEGGLVCFDITGGPMEVIVGFVFTNTGTNIAEFALSFPLASSRTVFLKDQTKNYYPLVNQYRTDSITGETCTFANPPTPLEPVTQ